MNTRTIAEKLGWNYSERTSVISHYPIVDPPGANGLYVFVEPEPGKVVAMANTHLPADPYGPYEARDGATRDEVLQLENDLRVPAIQTEIRELPRLAARGIPVFLTGDFNTPSHLDWTPAVDAVRADVPYPVVWPVGKAFADAGFKDSFRQVYPNPVTRPGFSWTPGSPEGEKVEVHDRIDWVLSVGPATATASSVVGEPGNPNVDIPVGPWPGPPRRRLDLRRHASHDPFARGRRVAEPGAGRVALRTLPRARSGRRARSRRTGRRQRRERGRLQVHRWRGRRHAHLRYQRSRATRVRGRPRQPGRRGHIALAILALRARRGDHGLHRQVPLQGRRDYPRLVGEGAGDEVGLARRLHRGRQRRQPARLHVLGRPRRKRALPPLHLHPRGNRGLDDVRGGHRARRVQELAAGTGTYEIASCSTTATARPPPRRASRSSSLSPRPGAYTRWRWRRRSATLPQVTVCYLLLPRRIRWTRFCAGST